MIDIIKNADGSWTSKICDVGDGSGDGIVPLPDEMLEQLGWDEDTPLVMEATPAGITIREA